MALLHFDGFESYGSDTDMINQGYVIANILFEAASGRRGGRCVRSNIGGFSYTFGSASSVVVGGAFGPRATNAGWILFELREGSTIHIGVGVTANRAIYVYRGTTANILAQSADGVFAQFTSSSDINSFSYIELKTTINDTTGSFDLRLNGQATALLSGSNVDTRNGGTTGLLSVLSFVNASSSVRIDDLYICDTTGPAPHNDFLGDCRIDVCRPNADGTYTAFAASAGNRFECVDETTPNSADYVFSSTPGDRGSFQTTELPASSSTTIYGLRVTGVALKDDTGGRSANLMVRSGTTDLDGAALALTTAAAGLPQMLLTTDPATGAAWSVAGVNALQIGARVSA